LRDGDLQKPLPHRDCGSRSRRIHVFRSATALSHAWRR
jgi:hypothetical protein